MSGMILDQQKTMETPIDFYDGEEYVKNMKKLLSAN